ncbi:carbohydrate kinase family protein [Candidatus Dependentiae bacterium]|nr:carbohydrate kinase family protein [Candidatus Dependentiae bacterium]
MAKNTSKQSVVMIGGATRDIYLQYHGADCMSITERDCERRYMLFESGAKVEVEDVLYYTGGGATNSAVSFKRLGFDVTCFCMIGDDEAGHAVLQDLTSEGIDTSSITVSQTHASGTSFVVNSLRRDRTIFAYRGANGFLAEENIDLDLIENASQLYITSLSHESSQMLSTIGAYAKKHNIPVAVNPGISQLSTGAQELKKSLKYIDILILNCSEAKTFMGALAEQSRESLYFSVPNFFKEVMGIGPRIAVVTDGAQGVYVATNNTVYFHPSMSVEVVDTLGAGDSFGSCFVGCLRRGMGIEDALRCGIVNSASVIGQFGAKPGLLSYDQLQRRVKNIKPGLLQKNLL